MSMQTVNVSAPLAVSEGEAAALLGVCPRTLWSWANKGLVRRVKIGRRVIYRMEDLRAFLERQAASESRASE